MSKSAQNRSPSEFGRHPHRSKLSRSPGLSCHLRSRLSRLRRSGRTSPGHLTTVIVRFVQLLEERHAGVSDRGVILVGDPSIVAEDMALFGLDHHEQAIDGRGARGPALDRQPLRLCLRFLGEKVRPCR